MVMTERWNVEVILSIKSVRLTLACSSLWGSVPTPTFMIVVSIEANVIVHTLDVASTDVQKRSYPECPLRLIFYAHTSITSIDSHKYYCSLPVLSLCINGAQRFGQKPYTGEQGLFG